MLYSRIIVNEKNSDTVIKKLNLTKKSEFAFYDLIYQNNNGNSITEDTLKIRVYQKNEWKTKNVVLIRKTALMINGSKEDKILLKKEFATEKEAIDFVNTNFVNEYEYKFKLEKSGIEYSNKDLTLWLEEIKDIGTSIEIGSENPVEIENAVQLFDIKERLKESVPEYLYNKLFKNN